MRYEEELIDEVREKNDIVDVISSYVSLKKRDTFLPGVFFHIICFGGKSNDVGSMVF